MDNPNWTAETETNASVKANDSPGPEAKSKAEMVWPETVAGAKGVLKPDTTSIANIEAFLKKIGVRVWRDNFAGYIKIDGPGSAQPLDDAHESTLWGSLNAERFRITPAFLHDALVFIAGKNGRNPVIEYIDRCAKDWDGVERIDRVFIDHCGANDTPLNRAIGRAFALSLVWRAKVPGCPLYGLPILEDHKGGSGKSSFARDLVGQAYHLSGMPMNADPQQVLQDTGGIWLVEASELVGMKSPKGFERVLEFVTRERDVASKKYARNTTFGLRRFTLLGTTNAEDYLPAYVGGLRRFWPVRVGLNGFRYDPKALAKVRDHLIGEAAVAMEAAIAEGKVANIPSELWAAEAEAREERMVSTPLEDLLAPVLNGKEGFVTNAALRKFVLEAEMDFDRYSQCGAVTGVMRKLGFKRRTFGNERGYLMGDDPTIELTLSKEDTAKAKTAKAEKDELVKLRSAETMRKAARDQAKSMKARGLDIDVMTERLVGRAAVPLQLVETPSEQPTSLLGRRLKSPKK